MKRHVELDMVASAQTVCAGIVAGLYACRKTNSDGALGWALSRSESTQIGTSGG